MIVISTVLFARPAALHAQAIPGALPESTKALSQGEWPATSIRICGCSDTPSGELLAEIALPANAVGAPITYMAGGKQYFAFPVGGGPLTEELIAVSL